MNPLGAIGRGSVCIAAIVLAAISVAAPASAFAHKLRVTRTVFLEPSGDELHMIVALRVPSGDSRRGLELSTGGRAGIEPALKARALDGLHLFAGTATLSIGRIEVKSKIEPGDGKVEVMVHGVATLPKGASTLGVGTGPLGDPLDLAVLPGTAPVVSASRGKLSRGGLKVSMGQGDRVRWAVRRSEERAPSNTPLVPSVPGG